MSYINRLDVPDVYLLLGLQIQWQNGTQHEWHSAKCTKVFPKMLYLKYLISCKSCAVGREAGSLHVKRDVASCRGIGTRGSILCTASSSCVMAYSYYVRNVKKTQRKNCKCCMLYVCRIELYEYTFSIANPLCETFLTRVCVRCACLCVHLERHTFFGQNIIWIYHYSDIALQRYGSANVTAINKWHPL